MSSAAARHAGVTVTPLPGGPMVQRHPTSAVRLADDLDVDEAGRLAGFVTGPENQLLGAVIDRLASALDDHTLEHGVPSPLVLVGPHGCGKTRLASALVERWQAAHGDDAAQYVTASDFARGLADAIRDDARETNPEAPQRVRALRRDLRKKPLLAIDDIHRLGESPSRQAELRNTIDAITDRGGLLVLTSTGPLAEATAFDRPLLSRIAGGLTIEIAPLGIEARRALLEQAAAAAGTELDHEAATRLAEQLPAEPPMVLRAAIELRRRSGKRVDAQSAQRLIDDDKPVYSPPLGDILRVVARYHKIPLKVLTSASRRQTIVMARAIAIYLARELTPLSYSDIGRGLGGRDHTTIMHNFRRIDRQLPRDRALRSAIEELRRLITTG